MTTEDKCSVLIYIHVHLYDILLIIVMFDIINKTFCHTCYVIHVNVTCSRYFSMASLYFIRINMFVAKLSCVVSVTTDGCE